MSGENGHLAERVQKTEADHRDLRQFVMDEFSFVKSELKDIKAALDLVLKTLEVDERRESEGG